VVAKREMGVILSFLISGESLHIVGIYADMKVETTFWMQFQKTGFKKSG
jgi:hypothetical protein